MSGDALASGAVPARRQAPAHPVAGDPARPADIPAAWGLRDVTVTFGGGHRTTTTTALDSVTVPLAQGRVTALVGGDGAGKSTVLRAMLGRVPVTGTITMPPLAQVGYQPSSSGVWRHLSVEENLDFVGEAFRLDPTRLATRKNDLLARAGLAEARDRLGGQLSGGMRQKLGFIMAILAEPRVLLLDEPSTGVDPVSRVELWRLIAGAATGGAAVAMTTTYLDEAERAATIVALDAGHVLATGDADAICAAVPGTVTQLDAGAPTGDTRWRRGTAVHQWNPPGLPARGTVTDLDLEDAMIALVMSHHATQEAS